MKVFYDERFNIDLGLLNRLHPFEGRKFAKVHDAIEKLGVPQRTVPGPVAEAQLDAFAGEILRPLYASKRYILRALEVPYIPLLPFGIIDRRVLEPMRWAVQGTITATEQALAGSNCWNLSGGYHHASRNAAEGFCVYNDVGIAVQEARSRGLLGADDRIMIVDVDAHHGNGNAHVFLKDRASRSSTSTTATSIRILHRPSGESMSAFRSRPVRVAGNTWPGCAMGWHSSRAARAWPS